MQGDAPRKGLVVKGGIVIPPDELVARATKSGGPGGQHVNTSSTRVELLWLLPGSRAVSDAQRAQIIEKLGARLDAEGNVRVVASDTRSQFRNRALAEERLATIVAEALVRPKPRRRTKPTRASIERRLTDKKKRSERKSGRRGPHPD